jgi:magnesium chelatase family protein
LSGPMLGRIEMHVHLPRISVSELRKRSETVEPSAVVRERVKAVRDLQMERQADLNSNLAGVTLEEHCQLDDGIHQFLDMAYERLRLSARAYHRILRLARPIADMSDRTSIEQTYIAEAIGYRSLDRQNR